MWWGLAGTELDASLNRQMDYVISDPVQEPLLQMSAPSACVELTGRAQVGTDWRVRLAHQLVILYSNLQAQAMLMIQ